MKSLSFVLTIALGLAGFESLATAGPAAAADETAFGTAISSSAVGSERISYQTFLAMKKEATRLRKLGQHLTKASIYSRFRGHRFEHNIEYEGTYRASPYDSTFNSDGSYVIRANGKTVTGKWKVSRDFFCTKPAGNAKYSCSGRVYSVSGGTVIWFKLSSGKYEIDGLIRKQ